MKYLFKTPLALLLLGSSQATLAQMECSELTFAPLKIDGNKHIVELVGVNSEKAANIKKYIKNEANSISRGNYKSKFEPGEYSLMFKVWDKDLFMDVNSKKPTVRNKHLPNLIPVTQKFSYGDYSSYGLNDSLNYNRENNKNVIELNFRVKIDANSRYKFGVQENSGEYELYVKDKSDYSCTSSKNVYKAKSMPEAQAGAVLPKSLYGRLQKLMIQINANDEYAGQKFVPMGMYSYFGAILDPSIKREPQLGLQVLSVLPYSLASRLRLLSGDYIIAMGDKAVANTDEKPNQLLYKYLGSLSYGKEMKITVIRNGQETVLTDRYMSLIVPETRFTVGELNKNDSSAIVDIKQAKLDNKLKFEYEQLMLEISNFFKSRAPEKDVNLQVPASYVANFGLRGKMLKSGNQGFKVLTVEPSSIAMNLGIQKNDVVEFINSKDPITTTKQLIDSIGALKVDQEFFMIVNRGNETKELRGTYNPVKVPAFSMYIEMQSLRKAELWVNNFEKSGPAYTVVDGKYTKPAQAVDYGQARPQNKSALQSKNNSRRASGNAN